MSDRGLPDRGYAQPARAAPLEGVDLFNASVASHGHEFLADLADFRSGPGRSGDRHSHRRARVVGARCWSQPCSPLPVCPLDQRRRRTVTLTQRDDDEARSAGLRAPLPGSGLAQELVEWAAAARPAITTGIPRRAIRCPRSSSTRLPGTERVLRWRVL